MKKYYLAYGSNLNLTQMLRRCPTAKVVGKTTLQDYRLVFKGKGNTGFLTIEEVPGSTVPVGVFEITEFDEANLDGYEGYPTFYDKKYIEIEINNQKLQALTYVMNPNFHYALPSMDYLHTCSMGYIDFNFNRDILFRALENSINDQEKRLIK